MQAQPAVVGGADVKLMGEERLAASPQHSPAPSGAAEGAEPKCGAAAPRAKANPSAGAATTTNPVFAMGAVHHAEMAPALDPDAPPPNFSQVLLIVLLIVPVCVGMYAALLSLGFAIWQYLTRGSGAQRSKGTTHEVASSGLLRALTRAGRWLRGATPSATPPASPSNGRRAGRPPPSPTSKNNRRHHRTNSDSSAPSPVPSPPTSPAAQLGQPPPSPTRGKSSGARKRAKGKPPSAPPSPSRTVPPAPEIIERPPWADPPSPTQVPTAGSNGGGGAGNGGITAERPPRTPHACVANDAQLNAGASAHAAAGSSAPLDAERHHKRPGHLARAGAGGSGGAEGDCAEAPSEGGRYRGASPTVSHEAAGADAKEASSCGGGCAAPSPAPEPEAAESVAPEAAAVCTQWGLQAEAEAETARRSLQGAVGGWSTGSSARGVSAIAAEIEEERHPGPWMPEEACSVSRGSSGPASSSSYVRTDSRAFETASLSAASGMASGLSGAQVEAVGGHCGSSLVGDRQDTGSFAGVRGWVGLAQQMGAMDGHKPPMRIGKGARCGVRAGRWEGKEGGGVGKGRRGRSSLQNSPMASWQAELWAEWERMAEGTLVEGADTATAWPPAGHPWAAVAAAARSTLAPAVPITRTPSMEERCCCVCLDAAREYAFMPCGHRCVCELCAESTMRSTGALCPVCRRPVQGSLRIYD
ncbi:hypothetical protein CYMTET_52277 [Cymbomonas tetramitiformis]|uniref:RING-type domain-containing protein n=1 Tax=Cymbomonas tetramitiformis TaxID=36881 RepID=A0AAE0EQY9_9CHLO|nr:hypothetical protein CYMTET_52277 [Cymbomonas tetramitiformis]